MFSSLLGASYTPIRMFQGIATYDESFSDKDLKQVRHYNKVTAKLAAFDPDERQQLASLFDKQWRCPPILFQAVGSKGGLLIWYASKEELIKLCKSKMAIKTMETWIDKRYQFLEDKWSKL